MYFERFMKINSKALFSWCKFFCLVIMLFCDNKTNT